MLRYLEEESSSLGIRLVYLFCHVLAFEGQQGMKNVLGEKPGEFLQEW